MSQLRVLAVLGEVCAENEADRLAQDLFDGLATCSTDLVQSLTSVLLNLSDEPERIKLDDGVLLRKQNSDVSFLLACRPSAGGMSSVLSQFLSPVETPGVVVDAILIYSGLISEGSGHWLLPNYVFTPVAFADEIAKMASAHSHLPIDAENGNSGKRIRLHIGFTGVKSGGEWRQLLNYKFPRIAGQTLLVSVNNSQASSASKLACGDVESAITTDLSGLQGFLRRCFTELPRPYCPALASPLTPRQSNELALIVARPCLYVFPEGSGQSAIFSLPGYSMLINAGCSHRPCVWPVVSHLDRVDSVFITHWGLDNLLGLCSVLSVISTSSGKGSAQDSSLCLLCPPPNPATAPISGDGSSASRSPLCLSLPHEFSKLTAQLKRSGVQLIIHPLTRGTKLNSSPPALQLYHKVGQGTLEMLVLTPSEDDSAELRKLNDDWSKSMPSLTTAMASLDRNGPGASKVTVPLLSYTSVSALLLWRPALETEPILRILFVSPNAHQSRILVSLDAVAAANIFLRHQRAVPADFERKKTANPGPRRTMISGATAPISKLTTTASGVNSSGAPKRPTTVFQSAKKEAPVSKSPISNRPQSSKSSKVPSSSTNGNSQKPLPIKNPAASETVTSKEPDLNVQNGSGTDTQTIMEHLSNTVARTDLNGQDELVTSTSPLNTTGPSAEPDPLVASWGVPQGLPSPAPPIGPSHDNRVTSSSRRMTSATSTRPTTATRSTRPNGSDSAAPIAMPLGYTDASAHAAGPGSLKLFPYDKVKPFYVDVCFVPGGGNPHLVDAEWFKRVRARTYIVTDPKPTAVIMESVSVGKEAWTGEDANLPVDVVFAYESDEVVSWLVRNTNRSAANKISVPAIGCRSNIQLVGDSRSAAAVTCVGYRIDL